MCDRIGIFSAGRLIGQGTMAQLAERFGEGKQVLEVGLDDTVQKGEGAFRPWRPVPGVASVGDSVRPGDPWHLEVDRAPMRRSRLAVLVPWRPSTAAHVDARSSRRLRTSTGGPWHDPAVRASRRAARRRGMPA